MKVFNLLLLVMLTSCATAYKTKDIKKSYKKFNKQIDKSIKQLDKIHTYQKQALNEGASYGIAQKTLDDASADHLSSMELRRKTLDQKNVFIRSYEKIKLKGKRINDKKHPDNFKAVKNWSDTANGVSKKIGSYFKDAEKFNKSFMKKFKQVGYELTKTKGMKQQFTKVSKKLAKEIKKAKKQISKFRKQIKKARHKNKAKIIKELGLLDQDLVAMKKIQTKVMVVVDDFDKRFSKLEVVLHGPAAPTFAWINEIKKRSDELNGTIKSSEKRVKKINKLALAK